MAAYKFSVLLACLIYC